MEANATGIPQRGVTEAHLASDVLARIKTLDGIVPFSHTTKDMKSRVASDVAATTETVVKTAPSARKLGRRSALIASSARRKPVAKQAVVRTATKAEIKARDAIACGRPGAVTTAARLVRAKTNRPVRRAA